MAIVVLKWRVISSFLFLLFGVRRGGGDWTTTNKPNLTILRVEVAYLKNFLFEIQIY